MNYKISVVMPVYNAEKTLETAIESVINQTFGFENIEFVIVDDCSQDNSKKIIEQYSNQYENIKCIYLPKNSGCSISRNFAIDIITGDYLMFLDSDDEFMPDYCETAYSAITEGDFDILYCNNFLKFLDGVYSFSKIFSKEKLLDQNAVHRHTLWGNLFKTSYIKGNDIKCPDTLCEDGVFCIKAFTKTNKIIVLPNYYGYMYTVESVDNDSVTHNVQNEDILRFIDGCYLMNDYMEENNLNKQRLIDLIKIIFFMFFKLDTSKNEKIYLLDKIYEFEIAINRPIILSFKPLDWLNRLILNKHYNLFIYISFIAGKLYTNRRLKNIFFKKYSNITKIDLDSISYEY